MSLGKSRLGILHVLGLVVDLGLHVSNGMLACGDLFVQLFVLCGQLLSFDLEIVVELLQLVTTRGCMIQSHIGFD